MAYAIIQHKDEFETGIPMGYCIIEIENKKDAPEGSTAVNTEKQLEAAIKKIDAANEKLIDALAKASK